MDKRVWLYWIPAILIVGFIVGLVFYIGPPMVLVKALGFFVLMFGVVLLIMWLISQVARYWN